MLRQPGTGACAFDACAPLPLPSYAGHRVQSEPGMVQAGARDLPNIPPEPPPESPGMGPVGADGPSARYSGSLPPASVRGAR